MRKSTLIKILLPLSVVTISLVACKKDDPATLVPPPAADQSFVEEFDTISMAFQRGWVFDEMINMTILNPRGIAKVVKA